MTTAQIRGLREKFIAAQVALAQAERNSTWIALSAEHLEYLSHLLRSHIIWREWLVPHD